MWASYPEMKKKILLNFTPLLPKCSCLLTDLTDGAVVGRLVPGPRPQHRFLAGWRQGFLHPLALLQRPQQAVPATRRRSGGFKKTNRDYKVKRDANKLLRSASDSLDHLEQLVVGHFDVACHVPGEVHHGNHGLDALELIPLVTLHGQLVLVGWKTWR